MVREGKRDETKREGGKKEGRFERKRKVKEGGNGVREGEMVREGVMVRERKRDETKRERGKKKGRSERRIDGERRAG